MREKKHSHQQLAHWIADRLRADVLEGRLRPGEWLRQERIAREQGASQMPVREALRSLAAEGLVEHVPYRGVRVVQFTAEDVEDLYACRIFIESLSARYAATRMTEEDVRELRDLHERMLRCDTPRALAEYRELNRRFHALIFNSSGRSFLMRTLGQLWASFPTMLWSNIPLAATSSAPGRDQPDAEEHQAIVDAIAAHDGDAAEQAMRAHIKAAGEALLAVFRGGA